MPGLGESGEDVSGDSGAPASPLPRGLVGCDGGRFPPPRGPRLLCFLSLSLSLPRSPRSLPQNRKCNAPARPQGTQGPACPELTAPTVSPSSPTCGLWLWHLSPPHPPGVYGGGEGKVIYFGAYMLGNFIISDFCALGFEQLGPVSPQQPVVPQAHLAGVSGLFVPGAQGCFTHIITEPGCAHWE